MTVSSEGLDGEALRLRSAGRSFAHISRELGLARPIDAQRAFQRAVRILPTEERERVRGEESVRLDRLAARVRAATDRPVEERDRQLAAIERLRALLPTGKD